MIIRFELQSAIYRGVQFVNSLKLVEGQKHSHFVQDREQLQIDFTISYNKRSESVRV